jgi:hypothetical protein
MVVIVPDLIALPSITSSFLDSFTAFFFEFEGGRKNLDQ